MNEVLSELQRIPTSGARAVEPFAVDGLELLAIPQLAVDIPGQAPGMHAGDSDTDVLLFQREGDRYTPFGTLTGAGGEDAEHFVIDGRSFLAVASLRTGAGPYSFETESMIWTWIEGGFVAFQAVESFAAKQFRHWTVDGRHFLGLAQGVAPPGSTLANRPSLVFEFDGSRFVPFQEIPSEWAYNWHPFTVADRFFVAHAEHLGPSVLYRWDGDRLEPHQALLERAGRAFATFERDGESYLVAAGLEDRPRVMRWQNQRFEVVDELDGLGGRELTVVEHDSRLLLIRVNFIVGTPADPRPSLTSLVYEWVDGRLEPWLEFPTTGGTDAAVVDSPAGDLQFVVSNSLAPDLRFASDTVLYSIGPR
jgi:hypothetical protein